MILQDADFNHLKQSLLLYAAKGTLNQDEHYEVLAFKAFQLF